MSRSPGLLAMRVASARPIPEEQPVTWADHKLVVLARNILDTGLMAQDLLNQIASSGSL